MSTKKKKYASSVFSQKSTTSAKSGRSFLSLGTPQDKDSMWKTLKHWLPTATITKRSSVSSSSTLSSSHNFDVDTLSTNSSTTTNSTSRKLRNFFFSPVVSKEPVPSLINSQSSSNGSSPQKPPSMIDLFPTEKPTLTGILVHHGGSAQEVEEQRRRRRRRRQYLIRAQQQESGRSAVGFRTMGDSSSSSTLLSTPPDHESPALNQPDQATDEPHDKVDGYGFTPRVMFVEPSPVPRFRNEPPAPPPTPPYLNVFVQPPTQDPPASSTSHPPPLPQTALQPFSSPTANTKKPRLVFQSPLHRGQSIPFALHNTLPDDHLIIYKFLTSSNSSRSNQRGQDSHQERYYVRPSSGKISSFHAEIWLILNQTPPIADGASLKDKILVRWAVVQRGTQVEQWAQQQLTENTRRKWLEMLLEAWPDQVLERKTRLSIRFT